MRLVFAGFGTVSQGLAELLVEKKEYLQTRFGLDIKVIGISDLLKGSIFDEHGISLPAALDAAKKGSPLSKIASPFEGDALALIDRAGAGVLVEATYTDIKTAEPATSHIRRAFERGLHVATTNKGPVALYYRELAALARERGLKFLFEGTVMSGTPLLNLIRHSLAASKISEIQGILNGTTNYILTRMEEGLSYEEALKKAQDLGYAEAVPDADVLGWDALAKVTILAKAVFEADGRPFDYPCKGIAGITPQDISQAKNRGKRFKLIGRVWQEAGEVKASVSPQEIDISHPLASISGATNAVAILTDTLGEVTIAGPGAGRRETGYSLLSDLIEIGGKR